MSWADDLKRLCEKRGDDLGNVCRAVKIELFSSVVRLTRVDTGRMRGNWQCQDGSAPAGELDRLDKTGAIVNREIIEKSATDGKTYFVNNLPYAIVYEKKDAMIGRSAAMVRQNIEDEARKK